jgi:hypothetical protein
MIFICREVWGEPMGAKVKINLFSFLKKAIT